MFLQNGYVCVLKDTVDVNLLLDKNLTSLLGEAYKHHTILVWSNYVENSI